jgi:hypothetical protein
MTIHAFIKRDTDKLSTLVCMNTFLDFVDTQISNKKLSRRSDNTTLYNCTIRNCHKGQTIQHCTIVIRKRTKKSKQWKKNVIFSEAANKCF